MITLLSPAKTLDFDSTLPEVDATIPEFMDESTVLISKLRGLSKRKVSQLMNLNKELTELNVMRYQEWQPTFDAEVARPAMLAFNGDVYRGLNASDLTQDELSFSQDHLRIVSGLHGLLRPLDRIRPYRLEMGTRLPIRRKKNLYEFWSEKVTRALQDAIDASGSKVLVNLASNEYAKAIDFNKLDAKVITPVLKDFKNGEYKSLMTYAKHARGAMARFIIKEKIEEASALHGFKLYTYAPAMSSDAEWVYVRE
jgi:hypothetical protein